MKWFERLRAARVERRAAAELAAVEAGEVRVAYPLPPLPGADLVEYVTRNGWRFKVGPLFGDWGGVVSFAPPKSPWRETEATGPVFQYQPTREALESRWFWSRAGVSA